MPTTKKKTTTKTTKPKKEATKKASKTASAKKTTKPKAVSKKTTPAKVATAKTTTKKASVKASPKTKKTTVKKAESKSAKTSIKTLMWNNKKLPKRTKLETYSCIWRMYVVTDAKTKNQVRKRYWIVIGDGHKKYRKFETQAEAIVYFRSLKKYAKMRVQTIHSKDFIKSVFTFYEMIWRGIDEKEIKPLKKAKAKKDIVEEQDFEDEYSKFDTLEIDNKNFNENEINKVLSESEGDAIIIDDFYDEKTSEIDGKELVSEVIKVEEEKPQEETQRIFTMSDEYDKTLEESYLTYKTEEVQFENNKTQETEIVEPTTEIDPYAVTSEVVFEEQQPTNTTKIETVEIKEEPQSPSNTSLYDLAEDSKDLTVETPVDLENNTDDNMEITQYQTALINSDKDLTEELVNAQYNKKLRIIFWVVIVLISLALIAIVVIALLGVKGIFG